MIIKVENTLDQTAQYSYLASDITSGLGTIDVKNINAFQANWAVQIGKTGEELSEIKVLGTAAPSGVSLVFAAGTNTFSHNSDTPVYAIKYDKVIFKRSTSGTAGTATALTNGTVNITPDSTYTQFDDTTSAAGYAYKASFYNSVTTEQTADSDWLPVEGMPTYSRGILRKRTKNKLFSAGYIKDDEIINDWLNEWLEIMDRAASHVNQGYNLGSASIAFGTNGLGTITNDNFIDIKRVWITYDGVDSFKATQKNISEVFPNEVYSNSHPYFTWQNDTVFEVLPAENGGTASILIYQRTSPMNSDGDELPQVMRAYTNSFVSYALAEAYYLDGQAANGDRYLARANAEKEQFVRDVSPRGYTGVETISIDYVVTAEEDWLS